MAADNDIGLTGTGALLVAIGKLEAQQSAAQRASEKCADQNDKQLTLLSEIREEMRVANTAMGARIKDHDTRLNVVERLVGQHEIIVQQGQGIKKLAATGTAAGGGIIALLLAALAKKLGW